MVPASLQDESADCFSEELSKCQSIFSYGKYEFLQEGTSL